MIVKVCPVCGTNYPDEAAFCARDRTPLGASATGLVGRLLAERYQIERKLGEGGMGEVYLARHILMGRASAIKVMSATLGRDPDAINRFNREATNASRIDHPNVCAVYDFGVTPEGQLFLAMEYLEGPTLTAALARGPLTLERAGALLTQCAAGLTAAHELGIVHRDLKPDNIMLVERRGRETAKLVDFGIAKAGSADGSQRVTRTGFVVGTPEYMSPEQLSSDEIDGRSDQYSLALVFCRMLTGALPFTASSAQETLAKRLTEPPQPLTTLAPDRQFPSGLQAVINRALARQPGERYPTVEAFAEAVNAALTAEDPVVLPRTRVVAGVRHRGRLALAGAGVVVVAAVAWATLRPPGQPTTLVAADTATVALTAVAPDSGDLGSNAPVNSEVATPQPTAPPPQATTGAAAPPPVAAVVPRDEDFDDAHSDQAARMAPLAKAIADDVSRPSDLRANMAFNYASYLATRFGNRREAYRYYKLSCDLVPKPSCQAVLADFKDTP